VLLFSGMIVRLG